MRTGDSPSRATLGAEEAPVASSYVTAQEAVADPELFDSGVTVDWLRREAVRGRVPSYKFGSRTVKFRREDLRRYIERSRRTAQAS